MEAGGFIGFKGRHVDRCCRGPLNLPSRQVTLDPSSSSTYRQQLFGPCSFPPGEVGRGVTAGASRTADNDIVDSILGNERLKKDGLCIFPPQVKHK